MVEDTGVPSLAGGSASGVGGGAGLAMGVLDKLYLRFETAFWAAADAAGDVDLIGRISENKGEWCEFLNVHHYTGKPILLCFNAGAYAEALAADDDATAIGKAMDALRSMFGADVPEPVGHVRTRWGLDPFVRGSYSHTAVGGSPEDLDTLAQPFGRLAFAGEHTYSADPATVRGAWASGLRAANDILAAVDPEVG